ncbi:hypothetical protein LCGC14_1161270 [marine sediment metagenome]|uniref:Uncharacterized protein n=1 Tax=marine sediment metagenome TaxID=412755 RepID=A0A0F9MFJ4_9ZZZZ|nr:hypothetical protein [Candidatus Aminicenantes bacterium]
MSFNAASFVLASSGPYRLWLYETDDNLASLTNSAAQSDYFKSANWATIAGGQQGVRRGDVILAVNASTKLVTSLGVVLAIAGTQRNAGSVVVQSSAASRLTV